MLKISKLWEGMAVDNVTPLRDSEPTRPHMQSPRRPFEHNPPPPPQDAYGPNLPKNIRHEMAIAREIFVELLNIDGEARARVVQQVEHLLKMYGDDATPPNVEGAPV